MQHATIQVGRYASHALSWFYRGERVLPLDCPFPCKRERLEYGGQFRYEREKMLVLDVQEDGYVHVLIRRDPRTREPGDDRVWGLMGKLLQCRTDGTLTEALVEDCGKFYIKNGAEPSPIDCYIWEHPEVLVESCKEFYIQGGAERSTTDCYAWERPEASAPASGGTGV